ncbi:major capsid protein [Peromfec virus RodF8_16]|uniref:Major capsid protein n=1 Tax=Peromfec virus RodF8_16 TaxID=2929360 RepID=A0A976N271_9VIRU|nr:major capsid protein [Peromfec virus RodF8_16]
MANIMSQKSVRNKVHRNGFDLSFRNGFTAKVGQVLPVMCKEVLPGDKFNIDINAFARTQPVQTAAFTRIQEYYDFYFVPTTLLWDKFDNFIVQTKNFAHAQSLTSAPSLNSGLHPYFTYKELLNYLHWLREMESSTPYTDIFGFSRYRNALRILQYLDYGITDTEVGNLGSAQVPPSGVFPNDIALNPFPLLAYQKICQDYFRFSQWETSQPQLCNLDYIFNDSTLKLPVSSYKTLGTDGYAVPSIFDLHYCNYKKDIIMGLLPSAQFGDTAIASPLSGGSLGQVFDYSFESEGGSPAAASMSSVNMSSGVFRFGTSDISWPKIRLHAGDVDNGIGLSVFALRFAEASQKWKEITQSGSLDYKEQIAKHWNVTVSDDQSYLSRWLGGTSGNISINEVTNTNLSDADSQANIAGKGVASVSRNNVVNFTSNQYGYLLCIYHAAPVLDWTDLGIDRMNLKTHASDYAIPEFDNIGMEEVPVALLDMPLWASVSDAIPDYKSLGYAPRYFDYKTSMDKIRGAFNTSLVDWVAPLNPGTLELSGDAGDNNGVLFDWRSFKVSPSSVDSIFGVSADSSYDTDQLLIASFFDIKCVRNLSVDGLPY